MYLRVSFATWGAELLGCPLAQGGGGLGGFVAERSFLGAHVQAVTWTTSTFGEKIVEPFFSCLSVASGVHISARPRRGRVGVERRGPSGR